MPIADKTNRSDQVRRRRAQAARQRFQATAQAASTVRPLISRPRRVAGSGLGAPAVNVQRVRRGSGIGLGFGLSLPVWLAGWRLASFSIVLLLVGMLARLLTDPRLYVTGITLGGSALVPGQEIYAASGVARQHIFWVDPAAAQQRVAEVPGIASALVRVAWPGQVIIQVQERVPVAAWTEGANTVWVDAEGSRFPARDGLPGLLPITVDDAPAGADARPIPVEAIHGALQLKQLRANIELLHYDALHGLSYQDGRGWRGYFGMGADMAEKLAVYETLTDNLTRRGIYPATISVEDPAAPYYRR